MWGTLFPSKGIAPVEIQRLYGGEWRTKWEKVFRKRVPGLGLDDIAGIGWTDQEDAT